MKTVVMFPGQGSQYRGMGQGLFSKYPLEIKEASDVLGYDIEELCLKDSNKELGKTQFTQPALYVVNALSFYDKKNGFAPDYFIGHSLGEYNALHAAGAFDFETGLRLVQKRGELMAAASEGGMAAVLGLDSDRILKKLEEEGYSEIDIANFNTPSQIVISGPRKIIAEAVKSLDNQGIKIIPLSVSAAFHSRYMKTAAEDFSVFLKDFEFSPLKTPVISNVTALPYEHNQVSALLSRQIVSPVRWTDTIRFLLGKDIKEYNEIGSVILTKMTNEIRSNCTPIFEKMKIESSKTIVSEEKATPLEATASQSQISEQGNKEVSTTLGSQTFRESYDIKYAYLAGAMYQGIASKELVVLMGKAKMLAFLGTGGMNLEEIETNIRFIQNKLIAGEAYGMNLLHNIVDLKLEMDTVKLYLKYGIQNIEAAAFTQMTLPLIYYRLKGLEKNNKNQIVCDHKIIAKVSRPEVAESFMRPAPEKIVQKLLDRGLITEDQAIMSKNIPVSHDICVEADSGGHTDGGIALVLLPSIQSLRERIEKEFSYDNPIHVGLAGGIGTPQAVACAFVMGADFVLTGSINQCTVESGTSDTVKDILQEIDVQDTDYAPAGDMFEIGARIQVLKKGVLFPARANKLYKLYHQYNALEDIPGKTMEQLERLYFKKPISEIWEETKAYLKTKDEESAIKEAIENPKKKMALVFRWYFGYSNKLSFEGNLKEKVNFQIHTGPAIGAFNQWAKGTELENWKNRHSNSIGIKMMEGAAQIMKARLSKINYTVNDIIDSNK